jgi:hypothetical protein
VAGASAAALLVLGTTRLASADEAPEGMPVAFGADQLRFDPRAQALDASGHVHVEQSPFYLTSDALKLRRVPIGVELVGEGKASFCPCLGAPLAVRFRGATVAPPHDLILRDPVLELFGLPIAWAPAVWLRSTGRFGLLPPEVSWRGGDGLFVGGGIHMPWRNGDVARGIDLRAGAYVDGGVAVSTAMRTAVSDTRIAWDRLHGDDGLALRLRGATAIAEGDRPDSATWDVDGLRGMRAVQATTDLDASARPFDRAQAQAAWLDGGWTFGSGVRTVALRGGDLLDLGVGGPVVSARRSDAIAHAGAYDATIEGGAVSGVGVGTTTFARAEGGATVGTRWRSLGGTVAMRGLGDVADDGTRAGVDGGVQGRATLSLPLARGFASADEGDPWVHRVEPRLEVAAMAAHTSGVLVAVAGRGMTLPSGKVWLASAGLKSAVGRWGSHGSAEIDASGGVVVDDQRALPVLRVRAAVGGRWLGLNGELARTLGSSSDNRGGALVARVRIGPPAGLHGSMHIADRDGIDPIMARSIVDAPFEPASGFLVAAGWTGGARLSAPLGSRLTTRAGADVDADARELVAALGAVEVHDPCNCVVVRLSAAHRIGRAGVDVWLSVDLATP